MSKLAPIGTRPILLARSRGAGRAARRGSRAGRADRRPRLCRAPTCPPAPTRPCARRRGAPDQRAAAARASCRGSPAAPGASGYYVNDLDAAAAVLFDRSEGQRRKLASNQKLFTTITALQGLGPTSAHPDAGSRPTAASTHGRAARRRLPGRRRRSRPSAPPGSPTSPSSVSKAGHQADRRPVIADDSIFDRLRGVPDSNYGPSPYIAPLSGLVYGGSTYDGDPALEPARPSATRCATPGQGRRQGQGRRSAGRAARRRPELASHGSRPIGGSSARRTSRRTTSTPRCCSRARRDGRQAGHDRAAARVVRRYAADLGSGVQARDGSGLTAGEQVLPARRRRAPRSPCSATTRSAKPLFDSLAIAGKDGTLDGAHGGNRRSGRCRGKTGDDQRRLQPLRLLQGRGGLVAFSLLMNGVGDLEAARDIQDRMVVEIARYRRSQADLPRRGLAGATRPRGRHPRRRAGRRRQRRSRQRRARRATPRWAPATTSIPTTSRLRDRRRRRQRPAGEDPRGRRRARRPGSSSSPGR